jgi:hypothetical protein
MRRLDRPLITGHGISYHLVWSDMEASVGGQERGSSTQLAVPVREAPIEEGRNDLIS